ncbi:hypothetical protein BMS3Bbin10_00220 [bacterium BMS3Bbin10]|nr:hypothetical protein BMS3Bbin10_00220 [bacterium BMS3Bbin10]
MIAAFPSFSTLTRLFVRCILAMLRLPRASFALLPATATLIGAPVLAQLPSLADLLGVALVMAGVAIHDAGQV